MIKCIKILLMIDEDITVYNMIFDEWINKKE